MNETGITAALDAFRNQSFPTSITFQVDTNITEICGPNSNLCNGNNASCNTTTKVRRSIDQEESLHFSFSNGLKGLIKRVFDDPRDARYNNDINNFISSIWDSGTLTRIVQKSKLADAEVVRWGNADQKVGIDGLFGCTSLIVASRRGLYITHYWAKPTFHDRDLFNDIIVRSLVNGQTYQQVESEPRSDTLLCFDADVPALVPLASRHSPDGTNPPGKILFGPDDKVKVGIVTPKAYQSSYYKYMAFVMELYDLIKTILPDNAEVFALPYRALSDEPDFRAWVIANQPLAEEVNAEALRRLEGQAQGKILVEYSASDKGYKVWVFGMQLSQLADQWS